MLSIEEMQKSVRANFKNIMDTHAAAGLPVVISENDKIFHLYKNGVKIEVKRTKETINKAF